MHPLLLVALALVAVGGWTAAWVVRRRRPPARVSGGAAPPEALVGIEKAVETMSVGVTTTDLDGRILYSNPADAAMHGYAVEELIGKDVRVFAPGGSGDPLGPAKIREMRSWRREAINVRKDGSAFPVRLTSDVVRDPAGQPVGVVTVCEDITEGKRAEAALRESEERYALAAHGANDGVWDWDLRTGRVYYSPRWKAMVGCAEAEVGEAPDEWLGRVHPEDRERTEGELQAHLEGRTPHFESEHRVQHKDGAWRWVLARGLAVRVHHGPAYRIAGSLTDITQRKVAEEQLVHDALHDPLTTLPNRAFFLSLLDRSIKRAKRHRDYLFAVLFVDLDRFKLVNDSLGHTVGDQLLVAIAERLRRCLRPGDMVTRLGGDEFTILLDDVKDVRDATRVAERVLAELGTPFILEGHEIFSSASIGIALSTAHHDGPEYYLRDADTAMYRAKQRGKARYELFDEAMHVRAVAMLQLETDLRRALEHDEFRLHYQPIVMLRSGRILGFESLVRWQHAERGLVAPGEFISLAEETGLIVPIGWWVMRTACRQTRQWQERYPLEPPLSVSVNLSARHFEQPNLADEVLALLAETGLAATSLKLEITESVLMDDAEAHVPIMRQLRRAGVQVQIDDFGTGYSSLSYLQRFSVDTLKIDRSFISSLGRDGESGEIVQTIIALARDLGVKVIAEGVETEEQSAHLRALACEHGQGYLFREPVDAATAEVMLAAQYERLRRGPADG